MSRREIPTDWIMEDLDRAIQQRINFLAALGLVCYTEALGREVLLAKGIRGKSEADCFNHFLQEYMGYQNPVLADAYNQFRCGLAHEYFIKGDRSQVVTRFASGEYPEQPGLRIEQNGALVVLALEPYLRDLKKGIQRCKEELQRLRADPTSLPPRAIMPQPPTYPASGSTYPFPPDSTDPTGKA